MHFDEKSSQGFFEFTDLELISRHLNVDQRLVCCGSIFDPRLNTVLKVELLKKQIKRQMQISLGILKLGVRINLLYYRLLNENKSYIVAYKEVKIKVQKRKIEFRESLIFKFIFIVPLKTFHII